MSNRKILQVFLLCVCSVFAAVGWAAPNDKKEAVQINLELFKVVVGKDGKESLVDSKQTKPGEIVEYRATYKNVSKANVKKLVAKLPVPEGMEYVSKTAKPANAEATIDNTNFAPIPLLGADKKEIPVKEYKAVRWHVAELAADKSFVVSVRMKVSQE
ncbi:DUF11 domain-containing protein [Agitococcus lubricus]|uniref:Putative repeat protein (TIGR01451 family) n=1 Tax=Agitococcus lubricus TaxID=1077255 RepID=A0A2T5J3P1_9GAMM|nr:DUF11 domain-containing protein [Agitococcus lubricus]PTQ91158.1 putative repeat protein (TIGR01451 family) [Agitococcus lubricus]